MIDRYDALNNSFEKTLIFRFGDQAGFFSELNNLILAVLYCLDSRIRCALYTSQVSPAIHWNDYFLSLIRFRGHLPKGGYDGTHGIKQGRPASAAAVQ